MQKKVSMTGSKGIRYEIGDGFIQGRAPKEQEASVFDQFKKPFMNTNHPVFVI